MWNSRFLETFNCLPTGVSIDSRTIQKGDVYVAIPCDSVIAHCHQAKEKGAVGIIAAPGLNFNLLPIIFHENLRLAACEIAKYFYPKQPEQLFAVTGTNGKTSVASFVYQFLTLLEQPSAQLGTVGISSTVPIAIHYPGLTTPDTVTFHKLLNELSENGIQSCVFEASSHGIEQHRIYGIDLKIAAFTNLTPDHLDYHKTMEAYGEAKLKLFTEVLSLQGLAVVNADDPFAKTIINKSKGRVYTYGLSEGVDLKATILLKDKNGIKISLQDGKNHYPPLLLPVNGEFQVYNILCALGMLYSSGIPLTDLIPLIEKLNAPQGRLQRINYGGNKAIYIDYAHTPDALKRALLSLRWQHPDQKLWVVFGCGGNRDPHKRPVMGQIADSLADHVIVTDDNPRFEDPFLIRCAIMESCTKALEVGDRKKAIEYTIEAMGEEDVLLIAGKGHETTQESQGKVVPFSDEECAVNYLQLMMQKKKTGTV